MYKQLSVLIFIIFNSSNFGQINGLNWKDIRFVMLANIVEISKPYQENVASFHALSFFKIIIIIVGENNRNQRTV